MSKDKPHHEPKKPKAKPAPHHEVQSPGPVPQNISQLVRHPHERHLHRDT
jgi:hypothetical protein